eukprot:Hpha_TRINITY_DN15110_c5_g5::TRINITY_DN15110_c5_g5_i1::g.127189::m.127189
MEEENVGHSWLLEVENPAAYVRDYPTEKVGMLWMKVRNEVERLFGKDSELLVEDHKKMSNARSIMLSQAEKVCTLIKQQAQSGVPEPSVLAACSVMQSAIRRLYHHRQLQQQMGDAICALVEKRCTTTESLERSCPESGQLLLWAVVECTQKPVSSATVRRLWILREGLSLFDWDSPRTQCMVDFCADVASPEFFCHDHAVGILKILFSQCSALTSALHRRIFCLMFQSDETWQKEWANALLEIWGFLEGLHRENFEVLVVRSYVDCAVSGSEQLAPKMRSVLQRFAGYLGTGKKMVQQGLRRQLINSELLPAFDSPNAQFRCNAVRLLGEHFPLHTSSDRETIEAAREEQINLISKALNDPVPNVRAAAVEVFFSLVRHNWESLQLNATLPVVQFVFQKLCLDANPSVRLACIQAIRKELLEDSVLLQHLRPLLQGLKHIDDGDFRVRMAYVGILCDLLKSKFVPVNELVSEDNLVRCVAVERRKPVLEGLFKLLRPTLCVAPPAGGKKGVPSTESAKESVRILLKIVMAAPAAAVKLYGTFSQKEPVKWVADLLCCCVSWVSAAKVAQTRSMEHVLVVIHEMLKGLAPRLSAKTNQTRKQLADAFSPAVLKGIETRFSSTHARSLVLDARRLALEHATDDAELDTALEALRMQKVSGDCPEWRLALERCLQEGGLEAVLREAASDVSSCSKERQQRGARVALELMSNPEARKNVLSDGWFDVRTALQNVADRTLKRVDKGTVNSECVLLVETLNRLTLWTASAQRDARRGRKSRKAGGDEDSESEAESEPEPEEEEEPEDCPVRSLVHWQLHKLVPAVQQLVRPMPADNSSPASAAEVDLDGEVRLAAIALTEQALVFLAQAVRCGNLARPRRVEKEESGESPSQPKPRLTVGTQAEMEGSILLGNALLAAMKIEPRLLPRALEVVEAVTEMLVGDVLLSDLSGLGNAAAALLRQACRRCDDQKVIPSDATAADAEECREPAWRCLINAGVHPKYVSSLCSILASAAPPAETRALFTSLWTYAAERSGRTAMVFVLVELAVRHDVFTTHFLDTVTELLTRRGDAAVGLTSSEISLLSLLFAAALCAPVPSAGKVTSESAAGRRLVTRLRAFKTQRLDRFFQIQRERELASSEPPGSASVTDGLASPVRVLPEVERPVRKSARTAEGSVVGSQVRMQPEARMSFQHLSNVLDALDWGGSKVVPRKTLERIDPEEEGRPQPDMPQEEAPAKRKRAPPAELEPESEEETPEVEEEAKKPTRKRKAAAKEAPKEEEKEATGPAKQETAKPKKGAKAVAAEKQDSEEEQAPKKRRRGTKPAEEEQNGADAQAPKKRQGKGKPSVDKAPVEEEQDRVEEEAPKKRGKGKAKAEEKPKEEEKEVQAGAEEGTKKQKKGKGKQDTVAKEEKPEPTKDATSEQPAPAPASKGRGRKAAAKDAAGETAAAEAPKAEGARKRTRTAPESEPAKKKARSPLLPESAPEPAKAKGPAKTKARSPLLPVTENKAAEAAPTKGRRGRKAAQ